MPHPPPKRERSSEQDGLDRGQDGIEPLGPVGVLGDGVAVCKPWHGLGGGERWVDAEADVPEPAVVGADVADPVVGA